MYFLQPHPSYLYTSPSPVAKQNTSPPHRIFLDSPNCLSLDHFPKNKPMLFGIS